MEKKLVEGKDYIKEEGKVVLLFEPTTNQSVQVADDGSVVLEHSGPQMSPPAGRRGHRGGRQSLGHRDHLTERQGRRQEPPE